MCLVSMVANAFSLSGTISTESNAPLPYVSIYLKDVYLGTIANLDGQYKINDIPAGKHTLVLSHVGYETQILDITIEKDVTQDFVMKEQAVTLSEVFVTPTGETLERFILNQVVKHTKKLSKRVGSFNRTITANYEQRECDILGPMLQPYMTELNLLFGALGGKAFLHSLIDNPNLKVSSVGKAVYKKGLILDNKVEVASATPALTSAQNKSWSKVLWAMQEKNFYDDAYDKIEKVKKAVDKLYKKNPDDVAKHFSYKGAYEEGDHVIHIIRYGKNEYHIADNCWQLRRIIEVDKVDETEMTDFCEVSKGFFMPSAHNKEYFRFTAEDIKQKLKELESKDTSGMSSDKLKTHKSMIQALKKAEGKGVTIKVASSINYKNFVMK